jgi:hypothetical protein
MWNKGDFVLHKTKKTDWGIGRVVAANSHDIDVFFVMLPTTVSFLQPAAFLEAASPEMIDAHPTLKNLSPGVLDGTAEYLPLPGRIKYFQKLFPDGFYDPAYLTEDPKKGERHYKVVARDLATSLLNESVWSELASAGHYAEICQRLAKVESKTNLLHSMEKIKWQAALKDALFQKPLSDALFNDLYGSGTRMSRFDELSRVLSQVDGCAKWTIATYYGFLLQPDSESQTRIFIKPEVTQFAAEACGWNLHYQSSLNWTTLTWAEQLASNLFMELTQIGLKPRDMIDVQSFIWCIDPKSYSKNDKK